MASNHVGDMFNGKLGRPAHGMGFGSLMQIVEDPVASNLRAVKGGFGWDGAFGARMWGPTQGTDGHDHHDPGAGRAGPARF